MKITSNKTVWRYFSVFFLFVFLITIGAKVQANDVAWNRAETGACTRRKFDYSDLSDADAT